MPVGPEFLAQGKGKPTSALPLQSRARAEFHRQSEPRVHQTACTKSESDVPAESGRPKRRRRVGWQIWVHSRVEIDELPRSPAMKLCSGNHRTDNPTDSELANAADLVRCQRRAPGASNAPQALRGFWASL